MVEDVPFCLPFFGFSGMAFCLLGLSGAEEPFGVRGGLRQQQGKSVRGLISVRALRTLDTSVLLGIDGSDSECAFFHNRPDTSLLFLFP